jgi:Ca-activated chloride channel homolog
MNTRKLIIFTAAIFMSLLVNADQVRLQMVTPTPVLEMGKKAPIYVKVSLTGFKMNKTTRPPVNVSIVLDKSGSMSGDKLAKAKLAAIEAVKRLQKNDIISIIAYDNGVRVLVPATKISDPNQIISTIQQLKADGGTALFAGVSKGAAEIRKFLTKETVSRVILLSDGQANQGPSTPVELGELGMSLIKEGISVSTIGLGSGYNEDLMSRLASKSDGNHLFAETPEKLIAAFNNEFGDVLSVVAQEVVCKITCPAGIRPIRILGRDADIRGQQITVQMNQLYSNQEKFIMLEVEVPAGEALTAQKIASCELSYSNMETNVTDRLSTELSIRFSNDQKQVAEAINKKAMVASITLEATLRNEEAMALRDQGKVKEAQQVLLLNCNIINKKLTLCPSPELQMQWNANKNDLDNIADSSKYQIQRKKMKEQNRANVYNQKEAQAYKDLKQEEPEEIQADYLQK